MMAWMALPLIGLGWLLVLAWGIQWNRMRERRRRRERMESALLQRYLEQQEHDAEERRGGRR